MQPNTHIEQSLTAAPQQTSFRLAGRVCLEWRSIQSKTPRHFCPFSLLKILQKSTSRKWKSGWHDEGFELDFALQPVCRVGLVNPFLIDVERVPPFFYWIFPYLLCVWPVCCWFSTHSSSSLLYCVYRWRTRAGRTWCESVPYWTGPTNRSGSFSDSSASPTATSTIEGKLSEALPACRLFFSCLCSSCLFVLFFSISFFFCAPHAPFIYRIDAGMMINDNPYD